MIAAMAENVPLMRLLLAAGANVDICDEVCSA
jgi:ankyrin repeat protein